MFCRKQAKRRRRRPNKEPVKYSKIIVALVISLNALFAAGALVVFCRVGSEPVALIAAWFGFTTGELWLLSGIKKRDTNIETKENENDD